MIQSVSATTLKAARCFTVINFTSAEESAELKIQHQTFKTRVHRSAACRSAACRSAVCSHLEWIDRSVSV